MHVLVSQESSGLYILLSNFGKPPAVIVRFSFEVFPVINEVNLYAAPAEWNVVSLLDVFFLSTQS